MQRLFLDFETRSAANLKKTGVHKYAEDATTSILCVGYAFNDERPQVDAPHVLPDYVLDFVKDGGALVAHNAPFELAIWNAVGVKRHGWPRLRAEQCDCTMARAYAMALPGSLDHAASAVGLSVQKDMAGHRLMMKMSQPRKRLPDGSFTWWEDEEDFTRLFEYCKQDIVVTQQLDRRLLPLSKNEKALWVLDQEINDRGVCCDVDSARKAILIVEKEQQRLNEELQKLTNHDVPTYNSHARLKTWIKEKGVETNGVAKNDVVNLLAQESLDRDVRRALEIRQEASKSSTAKLEAMVARANADGRIRGIFQYHGAGTGRWAGRGIQPHNFPRPNIEQEEIDQIFSYFDTMENVDDISAMIDMMHGPPISVISNCLRGFLYGQSHRRDLTGADFSSVEARVLAWLAGERWKIAMFERDEDAYKVAASGIYGVPADKIEKKDPRRQVGKVAELALGFQGGVGAMQTMAVGNGVRLAPTLPLLWNKSDEERRERAHRAWAQRGKKSGIEKREWYASELIKIIWRERHPQIVSYWTKLEQAAISAVLRPGTVCIVDENLPSVKYVKQGSFLFCKLPSGRNLCYPYPTLVKMKTPWGSTVSQLRYMAENSTRHIWERVAAYGGLLAENVTQAVARDLLAEALLRMKNANLDIVLHVHDEVVAETPIDSFSTEYVEKTASEVPIWAKGLPMKAEGWRGKRYRK